MLRHLTRKGYTCEYSDYYFGPTIVNYTATKENVIQSISKRHGFREDRELPKSSRSKNKDYKKSGYDRGHIAPDAIMDYDKEVLYETYLLSNVCPMTKSLNRYNWTKVERLCRLIAIRYDKVQVSNYILYNDSAIVRLHERTCIPFGFIKVLKYKDRSGQLKIVRFFYKNEKEVLNKKLSEHLITNNELNEYLKNYSQNKAA